MRYSLALALLIALPSWTQTTTTGRAETTGVCSPAVTGSNNQFTIECTGIGKEQGDSLLKILNKILAKQLDANVVMKKLDEIHNDIRQMRDRQGWAEMSKGQIAALCSTLAMSEKQKVLIIVPNADQNRLFLAGQLKEALQCAKWDANVMTMMDVREANAEVPLGLQVRTKTLTPTMKVIVTALVGSFGRAKVKYGITPEAKDYMDQQAIEISVWYNPPPAD